MLSWYRINWARLQERLDKVTPSIKSLTLIGFSLVVFPLTIALLSSANKVSELSNQSTQAILNVAEIVENNKELSSTFNKTQRFASQYVVLREEDILNSFLTNKIILITLIEQQFNSFENQKAIASSLIDRLNKIEALITKLDEQNINLEMIQHQYKLGAKSIQQLSFNNNERISTTAERLTFSANEVKSTILDSLIIIPLTILIAVIFISLIMRPLKVLLGKISRLEQGNFQERITFTGADEFKEIATALEMMRTRLHALELQKSSFIRHISHELKTPLAAIREGTELLHDNSVGQLNDDQQEITDILKSSVDRLQNLIEDLLDFNIVLDSTSLQDKETTNILKLINQSIKLRALDLKAKQINVNKDIQPIALKTNRKQLSVIIDNLLSNAIKYSPCSSEIKITAQLVDNKLQLAISDQGPGITTETQEKVFDAFYQGPPPEESSIKSSGLGLTIVKELLMRLNGEIMLTNNKQNSTGLQVTLFFQHNE